MEDNKLWDTIWIEAEEWAKGEWIFDDANSDVIVTKQDGTRWVATFISYKNVCTLTKKNKQTGENLSGIYLWMSDVILIDEVSREKIEEVIAELIRNGNFDLVFTCIPD